MFSIDGEDFKEFELWCMENFKDKFTISIDLDSFKLLSHRFYNLNGILSNYNKYDIFIVYRFFSMVKESAISLYILNHIKNKYKETLESFKEFK